MAARPRGRGDEPDDRGDNTGETFCRLFGTYQPFDPATLDRLYPHRAGYLAQVIHADLANIHAGYLLPADAWQNLTA